MQDVTAQVLSPHSAQPFPHPSPPEGIIILMLIVSFTCVFHLYYFCNYLMALKILCFKNEHEYTECKLLIFFILFCVFIIFFNFPVPTPQSNYFLSASFPPIFLVSSCVTPLIYLLIHVWWIISLYTLWTMLSWAYAWASCVTWVKWNRNPILHSVKAWGFDFFIGFIPIPPQTRIPGGNEILEGLPGPVVTFV